MCGSGEDGINNPGLALDSPRVTSYLARPRCLMGVYSVTRVRQDQSQWEVGTYRSYISGDAIPTLPPQRCITIVLQS